MRKKPAKHNNAKLDSRCYTQESAVGRFCSDMILSLKLFSFKNIHNDHILSSTNADTRLATSCVTTNIFCRKSFGRPKPPAPATAAPSTAWGSFDSGECHKHPPARDANPTVSAKTNSVPRVRSTSTDSVGTIRSRSRSQSRIFFGAGGSDGGIGERRKRVNTE